jgi:hypothetical protein
MIRVRLTRKLASTLNGVDLSHLKVGDIFELPDAAARMMIAERWAEIFDHISSGPQPQSDTSATN